jgi:sulfur carrier protein|uniref:Thiamine biosynthesis protein ThiS n=1 Tax=uncultured bacterium pAP3 TaxID=1781154 RepID=A0A1C9U4K3_9BACT|nr:thiamine biosynthesis protein ThiS [uncultured bacterium pAP3]
MQISVNGQPTQVPDGAAVAQLLQALKLEGRMAVEINGEIVPRSRWAEHRLQGADRVEIVRAIGGG